MRELRHQHVVRFVHVATSASKDGAAARGGHRAGHPLPRIVLPVGFEPRAVRLDISGMRALARVTVGEPVLERSGKFRMVRMSGRPCDANCRACPNSQCEARGQAPEIVVRGLRGGIGVCLIWMPCALLGGRMLLQDVQASRTVPLWTDTCRWPGRAHRHPDETHADTPRSP